MKKTTLRSLAFGLAAMSAVAASSQTIEQNMDELFAIADRNNTSIRSYQTAMEKAQQNVEAARAQRLPDVTTALSVSYIGTGQTLNRDFTYYANPNFPHWGNSFALEAQQVVYAGGALTNGIRMAELGKTMEGHNDESNRESVHMLLAGLYLQRQSLLNRLAVVEKNVMLADTLIDKTRNRYDEGVVLRNDITRYELMREQMTLQRVVIADRIKIVDKQMQTALYGENAEEKASVSEMSDIHADIQSLPTRDEAYWQNLALTENSNLKKAATSVELSKVQEKMTRAASLPKVAVTAADNLNGPNMINVPALDKNVNYWYVGVGVKYSISSIYKNKKNIRGAKFAIRNAEEKLDVAKEGISDAIHAAYIGLQTVRSELKMREKSMELARQNYDVISNRYNNGLALVTDMTDAANVRLDAELQYVDAQIAVALAYYKLKYVAGDI
ncbi:MAG: TolC family protein [Prevotella sp.]|nr:TolC family protein [Prevotella sp.]MBP3749972.1 TolC family protein [Prevotella sp.]